MITIPEGMGLDEFFGQADQRKNIIGVRGKGHGRRGRYIVPPGIIRSKYNRDRQQDDVAAREGEAPKKFRIAQMNMTERPSTQEYLKVNYANSINMPGGDRNLKIVGYNQVAPAGNDPDYSRPRGRVLVSTPEEIMAKDNVDILPDSPEFMVITEGVPGEAGLPHWQRFPAKSNMEAPDKLVYRNPSDDRPSWNERQKIHAEYEKEGEDEMKMGGLRVSEDLPLEDLDQWAAVATVAAAAISAGATGYQVYSQQKAAKGAKRDAKKQANAEAVNSAALFEQQFNQSTATRYGAPGQPAPGGGSYPPSMAPLSSGTDWTKIALFAGGGLVLVGAAYMILKS